MARTGNSTLTRWALIAAVLFLVGCAGPRGSRSITGSAVNDPLRGGPAPVMPASRENEAASAPSSSPAVAHPTAGTTSTSPAAMASGSSQPLDPSRTLQIGSPQPAGPAAGSGNEWKGNNPTPPPRNEPAPLPPPTSRGASPSYSPSYSPTFGGRVTTYEQAQAVLASRRVTWQRLETWGEEGEWKFSCSIPKPENPNIRRTFEARAREPITALQAVLEQIDREQR